MAIKGFYGTGPMWSKLSFILIVNFFNTADKQTSIAA